MDDQVTITKIQNPFDRMSGREIFVQPYIPGVTLNEIMVQYAPPQIRARHLAVVRNGVICEDLDAELFPGDSIAIIPRIGGGSCGGSIGQIAIMIAVIATAVATSGASLWIQLGAMSAVSVAGSLIINGLFPPPMPNFPQISGLGDSSSGGSVAYSWAGPQTSWTPGLPYPELFGKMRLGGQIINYYIETNNVNSRQTINLLLAMCEGEVETPVVDASEILINNEIKLDTLESYDFHTTKGETGQDCLPGFDQLHQYRDLSIDITIRVLLHLHGDVSPLVDSSLFKRTLDVYSGATLDTTNKKFGPGSIAFDGTGNAKINIADSDEWDVIDKDFSFSCQFRFIAGQTYYPILSHVNSTASIRWIFFYDSSAQKLKFQTFDASGQIDELSLETYVLGVSLLAGVFYHIELGRKGGKWGIWHRGVQTAWQTAEQNLPNISGHLRVGLAHIDGAWRYHKGNLDEIYFVSGKCLHAPGKKAIWSPNTFDPPTEAYTHDYGFNVETKGKADELIVQIVFLRGLYEINTSAVLIDRSCDFSIRYRQKSTVTWYLRQGKFGYTSGGGIFLPPAENDVIVGATSGAEGKFVSKTIDSGNWIPGTAVGDIILKDVTGAFEASENLNNTTKGNNNIATLSATAGDIQHYERVTANDRYPVRREYRIDCQAGRQNYEVKLERISAEETETSKMSDLRWTGLDEILDETLKYPYVSLLGLAIEASEELQGSIRNVAAVWDRGNIDVKNFNGVGTTLRASSNAAWASMFLLTTREGVDPTNIDETSWTAWANWCDGMVDGNTRITCNGVLDSQASVAAALAKLEQIGRAKIIKTGQKYRVAIEKPENGMIQVFSPGNITEGTFQLEFLDRIDRPDVYDIEFLRESGDFRKDKVPVYSANYSSLTRKPKHELIFLWGCTDEDVARRYGILRMQMSDKLNRFVNSGADVDAIACQVGDIIGFMHDGNKLTFGGRLGEQAGSPWTTIKLDQAITLDAATYSGNCTIWIQRGLDDTSLERTVTGPWDIDTDEIIISAAAENIAEDDVWAIGRATGEVIKYRNTDFARTMETKFRIGALEYNPDVYYHSNYDGGATAI